MSERQRAGDRRQGAALLIARVERGQANDQALQWFAHFQQVQHVGLLDRRDQQPLAGHYPDQVLLGEPLDCFAHGGSPQPHQVDEQAFGNDGAGGQFERDQPALQQFAVDGFDNLVQSNPLR